MAARRLPGAWTDALPFLATLLVTVAALDPLPILLLAPLYLLTAVWGAAFLAVRPAVANAAAGIVSLGMLAAADGTRTALATWLSAAVAISGATTATAWSAARARRAAARQAVLRRVAVAVAANSRHEPVLDLVAREAARWLSADGAGLVRFRDGVGEAVGWWGAGARDGARAALPVDGEDVLGAVHRSRVAQRRDDDRPLRDRGTASPIGGPVAGVAAPVTEGPDTWGALVASSAVAADLPPGAEGGLTELSELVAMAIEDAGARQRLEARASTDSLTGLANHRTFHERLRTEVERAGTRGGVAEVAAAIAGALGWRADECAPIHQAGLVHDVGKIGVPMPCSCTPAASTAPGWRSCAPMRRSARRS